MISLNEQQTLLSNKTKWKTVRLSDVCNIDPSKKELNGIDRNTEVSFGMMADLGEHKRKFIPKQLKRISELVKGGYSYFRENDVLLAKMTPCFENGKSGIASNLSNGIGFGSTEFYVIRGNESVTSDWLYYIVSSDKFLNEGKYSLVGTTGRRRLMKQFVESFEIPLPSLKEQKQITSLLKTIEVAIEDLNIQMGNTSKLKMQLLSKLFGGKREFGNFLQSSDFEQVKFGTIANNISQRVEPKETELNIYVGLEHLVPDNLTIERTGTPNDVIGTKLKIYKGDIIFGKRRAYQRKVAVSHFDGIASAHSMILRANENYIEGDFLPFLMQSHEFMSRAIEISEGSLSPTIKWKTLALQEFVLPIKKKQVELVILFKQIDATNTEIKQQIRALEELRLKLLNEILG